MKKKKLKRTARRNQVKKKFSSQKIAVIFVIVLLLLIGIYQIAYFFYSIRDVQTITTRVEVGKKVGFALGKKGLDFGKVMPGGSVTREMILVNQDSTEINTKIIIKGDISKLISTADKEFILKGNETKQVSFSVIVPDNARYGNYTGKIMIIFARK